MNGIRKTALFLRGLDRKTVELLLRQLDSASVASIRREMATLGEVSSQATKRVANEFLYDVGLNDVGQKEIRPGNVDRDIYDFSVQKSRPVRQADRQLSFDDLDRLGDSELSTLFHSVDALTALLSLVGAKPALIDRVTKNFSPTEESRMRGQLQQLGSIDPRDVDRARTAILEKAYSLLK